VSFELLRVDDRLIHGQVVVGWGGRLGLRRYVVVDDALADSGWEQDLYRSGLPEEDEALFLDVDGGAARFEELDRDDEPSALLTRGTRAMRRLAEAGLLEGRTVILGALGAAGEREEVLPYLHLGSREWADLRAISEAGARVAARDVPGARPVPLARLGRDGGRAGREEGREEE